MLPASIVISHLFPHISHYGQLLGNHIFSDNTTMNERVIHSLIHMFMYYCMTMNNATLLRFVLRNQAYKGGRGGYCVMDGYIWMDGWMIKHVREGEVVIA